LGLGGAAAGPRARRADAVVAATKDAEATFGGACLVGALAADQSMHGDRAVTAPQVALSFPVEHCVDSGAGALGHAGDFRWDLSRAAAAQVQSHQAQVYEARPGRGQDQRGASGLHRRDLRLQQPLSDTYERLVANHEYEVCEHM